MDAVTTLTTVVDSDSPASAGELPAVAYIGMGVAMLSMGKIFLEAGVKKAGGITGVRNMLARANEMLPQLEAGDRADRVE